MLLFLVQTLSMHIHHNHFPVTVTFLNVF